MLAGVSTRKFARVAEPVGSEVENTARPKSKSTVSKPFVQPTRTALPEPMARRLDDVGLPLVMLDGLEIAGRVHVVVFGISTAGVNIPLGLWQGWSTTTTPTKPGHTARAPARYRL